MNFMANKKIYFTKTTTKKKLRQSKLDGFLKNPPPTRTLKANRSAMLQEFFMGAVGPNRNKKVPKETLPSSTSEALPTEISFSSVDNNLGCSESRVIMAITEGRSNARGEVGIAAIDVNSPELILCQLSDDMWYSGTIIKIQMLHPVEVLLPNTFFNSKLSNSKLLTILRCTFPTVDFKETPRKHFHDSEALDRLHKISATNIDDVKIALENKYYALASCNALLSYVGIAYFLNFAEKSLRVSYESRYAAMTIDMETSKRLELVTPLSATSAKKTCLFSLMDHCMTRIGKRSLRARILEPFADVQMIRQYHEAIKELLAKENYQCTMRVILKKFHQVDRLMKLSLVTSLDDSIRASEAMISLTLMLKNCLATVPMLLDLLSALESSIFVGIRAGLEDSRYQLVLDHIDRILFTNAPQQNSPQSLHQQRINAVKPNLDLVLDLSRSFYAKILEEIGEEAKDLSTQHDMSFQLVHNTSRGYQLTLTENRTMLTYPQDLQMVSRRGNKVIFTTDRLNDLNARLKRTVDDILVTSNKVISEMLVSIRLEIDVVYLLTGIITELDLIQCFASLSRGEEFCCPAFGEETRIVDAIHPFLEFGRLKTLPVPNQVMATPDHNLFVITGPNMGGKTVYIKMVAVLQVMAQVGCFIPAQTAQFRICDKLFSRIGFEDSIDKGVSSFGMEVEQMSFILNHVTPNSLVIVDELGRGTNPGEGQEWAWQMCAKLAVLKGFRSNGHFYVDESVRGLNNSTMEDARRPVKGITSPFVYVTTHFQELTKLSEKFLNVVNLFLVADENSANGQKQLTYTHRVQVGVTPLKEYGLALARTVKFPRKVMPKAEEILQRIKERQITELMNSSSGARSAAHSSSNCSTADEEGTKEKLLYDLYSSVASICRRVSTDNFVANVDAELKGVLTEFGSKCSQDLRSSIRNLSLKETFNNSRLFLKATPRISCTNLDDTLLRMGVDEEELHSGDSSEDENEIIPETPQSEIAFTPLSNVTKATNTSWLTDVEGESQQRGNGTTIASQFSYQAMLRRLTERAEAQTADGTDPSPFNVHKGFPVLPFVKQLRSKGNEKGNIVEYCREAETSQVDVEKGMENGSADLFVTETESVDDVQFSHQTGGRVEQLQAGGDNILLEDNRNEITPFPQSRKRESASSFFDDDLLRNNDPEVLWETIQTQLRKEGEKERGFRFDSPEQQNNTQLSFASQFETRSQDEDRFEVRNGRSIPCTVTTNRNMPEKCDGEFRFDTTLNGDGRDRTSEYMWTQEDSSNAIQSNPEILGKFRTSPLLVSGDYEQEPQLLSPPNSEARGLWNQEFSTANKDTQYSETAQCSFDSNYNFRLGLLMNTEITNSHPKGFMEKFNHKSINRHPPSPVSSGSTRSEPHEFIARYGRIIQENYKKSQSQANPLRGNRNHKSSQNDCKEFLENCRAKMVEKKLFKEPPIPLVSSSMFRPNQKLHLSASVSSISSIDSNEPQVSKQDYSQWLGQYCRSRVQSLGVPTNRKRSHNSTMRSSRVRADIESVNQRWDSYYSEMNNSRSSGSSACSPNPGKHVSFGSGLGNDF